MTTLVLSGPQPPSLVLTAPGKFSLRLAVRPVTPHTLQGTAVGDINMAGYGMRNADVVSFNAEYDNGLSGAAKTIVLANATKQKVVVDMDTELTIDPTGAGVGNYQIRVIMDDTGGHEVALDGLDPASWLARSGAPASSDFNTAPNGRTYLNIFFDGAEMDQSLTRVGAA